MSHICARCATEEWRPVVGYEGWYEISNLGGLRRVKTPFGIAICKTLKPNRQRSGHLIADLSVANHQKKHCIHRLVAAAFIGTSPKGYAVNHIDFDPSNNRVCNLEYLTYGDNMRWSAKHNRHLFGERHHSATLTVKEVQEIRPLLAQGEKCSVIAKRYGVSHDAIRLLKSGKTWKQVPCQ